MFVWANAKELVTLANKIIKDFKDWISENSLTFKWDKRKLFYLNSQHLGTNQQKTHTK